MVCWGEWTVVVVVVQKPSQRISLHNYLHSLPLVFCICWVKITNNYYSQYTFSLILGHGMLFIFGRKYGRCYGFYKP